MKRLGRATGPSCCSSPNAPQHSNASCPSCFEPQEPVLLSHWTDDVVPTSSSCSTENSRILAPAFTFNCVLLSLRDASVLPKLFRRKYTKREARNCRGGLRQKEADENRIEALECADEDRKILSSSLISALCFDTPMQPSICPRQPQSILSVVSVAEVSTDTANNLTSFAGSV